jgi:heterodisulfide reductase subunit A-like polyferredoxin
LSDYKGNSEPAIRAVRDKLAAFVGSGQLGMFYARSLASPMDVYKSQDQARAAARIALVRALSPPQAEPAQAATTTQPALSRRTLFTFAGRPLHSDPSG